MDNTKSLEYVAFQIGINSKVLKELAYNIRSHFWRYIRYTNGKRRIFLAPDKELKKIQRLINKRILQQIPLPDSVHSARKKRSIRTNAEQHLGKDLVINIDIKDFYPDVHYSLVENIFRKLGYSSEASQILTKLTTYDYSLPQGFPTSPSIGNIVLIPMDERFENLCAQNNLSYSRWVDDITISGKKYAKNFLGLFYKIINQSGFKVNNRKTKSAFNNERQETTGVVVNRKPNIAKDKQRKINTLIHLYKTKGPISIITEDISKSRERLLGHISHFHNINPTLGNKMLEKFKHIYW